MTTVATSAKQCTQCRLDKPLPAFRLSKKSFTYSSECAECLNARQRRYNARPEVRAERIKPFGKQCNNTNRRVYDLLNFQTSYVVSDGCWEWTGSFCDDGYGRISSKLLRKRVRAHRFSYILHYGKFSDKLLVCHLCDNPKCVRPSHLFLGDHKANLIDASRKGRLRNKNVSRGAENANAKLTERAVIEIRLRNNQGESLSSLARELGVTAQTIWGVCRFKTWKHVPFKEESNVS